MMNRLYKKPQGERERHAHTHTHTDTHILSVYTIIYGLMPTCTKAAHNHMYKNMRIHTHTHTLLP